MATTQAAPGPYHLRAAHLGQVTSAARSTSLRCGVTGGDQSTSSKVLYLCASRAIRLLHFVLLFMSLSADSSCLSCMQYLVQ